MLYVSQFFFRVIWLFFVARSDDHDAVWDTITVSQWARRVTASFDLTILVLVLGGWSVKGSNHRLLLASLPHGSEGRFCRDDRISFRAMFFTGEYRFSFRAMFFTSFSATNKSAATESIGGGWPLMGTHSVRLRGVCARPLHAGPRGAPRERARKPAAWHNLLCYC